MAYPLSADVATGQLTAASHYNNLRADATRIGQALADVVPLGSFLSRYAEGVLISYLATNRVRVAFVTTNPATLMVNGYMLQAAANVDLAAGLFSGAAATWYIFAIRSAGSTTFTLGVNTSSAEAADQRVIGECYWDGTNVVNVKSYFVSPLSAPDYDSGWFAVAYNNTYTKAHNLAQTPNMVIIEHSTASGGTGELVACYVQYGGISGVGYDGTNVYFQCYNNAGAGVVNSTRRAAGNGYARVKAWR
jgi:hypothetical protein